MQEADFLACDLFWQPRYSPNHMKLLEQFDKETQISKRHGLARIRSPRLPPEFFSIKGMRGARFRRSRGPKPWFRTSFHGIPVSIILGFEVRSYGYTTGIFFICWGGPAHVTKKTHVWKNMPKSETFIAREEQGPLRPYRYDLRSEFDEESFPGGPGPGDLDFI